LPENNSVLVLYQLISLVIFICKERQYRNC